jgi:hypothetical protein
MGDVGIKDSDYLYACRNSSNLFACIGLKNKQYCILNKQYTKEEYEELIPKIKKHMDDMPYVDAQGRVYKFGEFFPPEFSPFAYNDTVTPEHFPLSKEEILAFGGKWYETPKTEFATTMEAENLPDDIVDTADLVTKEIIACMECKRAYRIISMELDFLRYNKIPLPRFCVDCRHKKRISQRNSSKLYDRSCACEQTGHDHVGKCQNEFQTSYAPDRPEIVYCEGCYQKEVI